MILMGSVTPGIRAPAETARNPARSAYSTMSWPYWSHTNRRRRLTSLYNMPRYLYHHCLSCICRLAIEHGYRMSIEHGYPSHSGKNISSLLAFLLADLAFKFLPPPKELAHYSTSRHVARRGVAQPRNADEPQPKGSADTIGWSALKRLTPPSRSRLRIWLPNFLPCFARISPYRP